MRKGSRYRFMGMVGSGAFMLQMGGCTIEAINDFVQTVFLGISAAGAVAILQNI